MFGLEFPRVDVALSRLIDGNRFFDTTVIPYWAVGVIFYWGPAQALTLSSTAQSDEAKVRHRLRNMS